MAYRLHTTIQAAQTVKAVGEFVISADWRKSKNQIAMERAIIVPMECVKAPDCDEAFRAIVESALQETASLKLKQLVNENPNTMEFDEKFFNRAELSDAFLTRNDTWMTSASLELSWMQSATWKKFTAREEFKTNATYQKAAVAFKDTVLKLAGKAFYLKAEGSMGRDAVMSKLSEEDLETPCGQFIVKRFEMMQRQDEKANEEISIDML